MGVKEADTDQNSLGTSAKIEMLKDRFLIM